jgi:hypothetical protein
VVILVCLAAVAAASADPLTPEESELCDAMRARVTLGNGYPVAHCRFAGRPRAMDLADPWSRCRLRLEAFARIVSAAAGRHDLDPWLLLAVAVRESGLYPHAEGAAGERGIVQLHPRGVGSRARFVRDDLYFRACRRRFDGCQGEVVELGAAHLAGWVLRCGGEAAGLGGYNRGRCGETGYSRRVMVLRQSLQEL